MDKLHVFISWSGLRSQAIAKALRDWIPNVLPYAEPWLSSDDLRKGLQWLPELNKNLSATGFGLVVLTADNKNAPWLLFEAGVISKALTDKHCCPVLCDLKPTDVAGPLSQFQSVTLTFRDEMRKLVGAMNEASGANKLPDDRVSKWFDREWADFSKLITPVLSAPTATSTKPGPTDRDLLEEVLGTVRQLAAEERERKIGSLLGGGSLASFMPSSSPFTTIIGGKSTY